MAIAVVLVLLVVGSVAFHFLSPWYFTPIASNWGMIDDTVTITFWVTGIVFVAVNLFLAYSVYKYRHREGLKADYEPENKKLEWWLTAITTVGVVAMLAPGLFVWGKFVDVPDDADIVEVVGQQWHWSFRFPGADGLLGQVDPKLMTVDNPFGLDPDDPNGQDDRLIASPELHLPLDRPVKLLLRSKDVLHNFTVPQFRTKMDLVPGMVTFIWLTPTRTGRFDVMCEELCGIAHHAMRASVVVDEETDFNGWLDAQPTFAELRGIPDGDATVGQAQYAACAACHGFQGEGNQQLNAPKLAGQEAWYLRRQIRNYKNGLRGSHQDDIYGQQMAGMAATLATDAAINNVIAFIQSLPDNPAVATVTGDVDRGRDKFTTCAICHGNQGQGIWALNAPRTAGMSDWYLLAQLQNFKAQIRGHHPTDSYGKQMSMMATMLTDETINDLVAYIIRCPSMMVQNKWL